jgi:hypothetical protein
MNGERHLLMRSGGEEKTSARGARPKPAPTRSGLTLALR